MVLDVVSSAATPPVHAAAESQAGTLAQGSTAHSQIPNLIFENRTRQDATQFDTVDQHGSTFHVVVAKTAYLLNARDAEGNAALTPILGAKLNVEDRYFDDDPGNSVRQESDFAPFKPACDVIVNATAFSPSGRPGKAFQVRLAVHQGALAGSAPLIDKTLSVSGDHSFKKKMALWRLVQWTGKVATLGLLDPNPWRLSRVQNATNLPLRYEFANGGQCRVDAGDPAAARVAKKARASRSAATTEGTHIEAGPVAHEASEENPCGRGFVRRWYLDAKRVKAFAAPRISAVGSPLTAPQFWRAAKGAQLPAPVGMGAVGRGWLPRRSLAGTFDEKQTWGHDEVPRLPDDFNFAYYNCAPRDQQCHFLIDQTKFTLLNLCSPEHRSGTADAKGNTVLRFRLPHQALFLIATDGNNKVVVERMVIDTVVIEPDESRVDLVWRALLPTDIDLRVARLMQVSEAAQIARLEELLQAQAALDDDASAGSAAKGTQK